MGNRAPSEKIGPFWRCLLALLAAIAVSVPVSLISSPRVAAEPLEGTSPVSGFPYVSSQPCMECHKQADLKMALPDGETLGLYVNEAAMAGSVHGGKLECTDCHSDITGFPHKKLQVTSSRDFSIAEYEVCKRCHFVNYTKTLDSTHYQVLESGGKNAPLCTDCHGAHDVTKPDQPRSKISQACGGCHKDVCDQYTHSVHGAALTSGNPDVPVCTDCHGAHNVQQADSARFRLNSPDMCGKCHSDAAKMSKYGLSANVYDTYMKDFHGVTVSLTKQETPDESTPTAVCTDCHGVHDIKSTRDGNIEQLKQNVVATCRKCHLNAGTNFPDAWMHHYELSLAKTPLPWLVRAFYWAMVPFMLLGLFLHMVVDLWRIARNR